MFRTLTAGASVIAACAISESPVAARSLTEAEAESLKGGREAADVGTN